MKRTDHSLAGLARRHQVTRGAMAVLRNPLLNQMAAGGGNTKPPTGIFEAKKKVDFTCWAA